MTFRATQLDRDVVVDSQIRLVIQTFRDALKDIFPGRTTVPKTLVFAKTDLHAEDIVLAPYGPKPVSLAMCLYGINCQDRGVPVEIGYTQPQVYGDQYSLGSAKDPNGIKVIAAYCIRLKGTNIYES